VLRAVRDVLAHVARRGTTITYGELVAALDEPDRGAVRDGMAEVLRAVSIAEDDAGRGLLTALVVRGDRGLPGGGWFDLAVSRGRDVSNREAAWRREVAFVHDAWREA